jgi:hypothetical protein
MDAATHIKKAGFKICQYQLQVNVIIANNKKYCHIYANINHDREAAP